MPGTSIWTGFLVGLIAHGVTGLMLLPGYLTYLSPDPDRKPRPWSAVVTLFAAGLVRGASVAWLLEAFGIVGESEYLPRMIAGGILVVIWFSVAAILVGARREYVAVYNQLYETLEKESLLATAGSEAVAKTRAQLVDQVKHTLSEAFASRASTGELHNLADSVIRPLSHALATHQELKVDLEPPKRRIELRPVLKTALNRFPFNPAAVAGIGLISTLYSRVWNIGPIGLLETLIQAVIIFGLFGLAKRLGVKGWPVPLVWLFVGLFANLGSWVILGYDLSAALTTALWLSIALVLPSSFVALLLAYDHERKVNIERLEQTLENVRWLERKLNQQLWIEKKRLARYVHSDIQGRVRAAALSNKALTMADVSRLQSQCIEALDLSAELPTFDRFLSDTVELWEGVAKIDLKAEANALAAISNDSFGLAAVVEIVREGVGNAVRHGKAKNISIRLDLQPEPNPVLAVEVSNDGPLATDDRTPGFGSQTISEVSSSWGLESRSQQTLLWAKVPVSAS